MFLFVLRIVGVLLPLIYKQIDLVLEILDLLLELQDELSPLTTINKLNKFLWPSVRHVLESFLKTQGGFSPVRWMF